MKLGHLLVALVLGASVLVACGDDDDDNGALSKSEFISQGDAICAKSSVDKLIETNFPTTQGAIPGFFKEAAAITRRNVEDLRALEEPEADKQRIDRLLATGDRVVADFERASGDAEYGAELFNEEGGENTQSFEKQARDYGFKTCGADDDEEEEEERAPVDTSGFSAEKKAYIKKADAVCREGNEEFSVIEQRYLKSFPPPLEVWAEFLPAIVEIGRPQLAELEAIDPPAADKAKIDDLLARQKELIDQFEQAGETAAAGDEEAFQEQSRRMFSAGDELDAELRAYGFQECGSEEE